MCLRQAEQQIYPGQLREQSYLDRWGGTGRGVAGGHKWGGAGRGGTGGGTGGGQVGWGTGGGRWGSYVQAMLEATRGEGRGWLYLVVGVGGWGCIQDTRGISYTWERWLWHTSGALGPVPSCSGGCGSGRTWAAR